MIRGSAAFTMAGTVLHGGVFPLGRGRVQMVGHNHGGAAVRGGGEARLGSQDVCSRQMQPKQGHS